MEKPTIEQIKKHFENAKDVKCLLNNEVYKLHTINDYFNGLSLFGYTFDNEVVLLYDNSQGYAEIISYHETKESKVMTKEDLKELKKDSLNIYDTTPSQVTPKNINEINVIFDEVKENETPEYYDNSKGSLYRISEDRKWNSYQFDIIKRIDRSLKKGQFKEDLIKTKNLIDLWLKEHNENNLKQ